MKTLLRIIVRVLEGVAIAVVLLAAVVFVQLARGPLALDPFVPYLESQLDRLVPGYAFSVGDAELNWRRLTRRPELTISNVQVRSQSNQPIAAFGSLDISIDIPQLITGRLVVEHLGIARPVVRIVRGADGKVSLGVETSSTPQTAPTGAPPESGDVTAFLLDSLRVSPDDVDSGPMLESVEISQSTVAIVDELSGMQWLIPDANFRLLGQRETIEIAGNLPLQSGEERINLDVAGRYTYAAGLLSLTASFDGVRPAVFAGVAATLDPLKAIDALMKGTIEVNLIPDNLTSDASWGSVALELGAGTLSLPEDWGGQIKINGASLSAQTSGGLDQIALDTAEVRVVRDDGLSPTISAKGRATNLRTAPAVDLQAAMDALTLQALKDMWPKAIAPNTRSWIEKNLSNGKITNVTAKIGLGGAEPWAMKAQTLDLKADIDNVTVNYIKGMPKVERAKGVLHVGLKEVVIDVTAGDVPDAVSGRGLRVGASKLRMFDLAEATPKADFLIKVTGDLGEALRLIDNEPLKYASAMNVDPNTASGAAEVDLSLKFPLLSNLLLDQLGINVKARVTQARIENVLFGMPLTDGDLGVEVVNTGLAVSGSAKLGPIATRLTWSQDFTGLPQESEYVLDAVVRNEDRPLIQLGFAPFMPPNIDGDVPARVVYRTMRDDTATLQADGDLTDITMAIPELGWSKAPGVTAGFKVDVALKDGALAAVRAFTVTSENDLEVAGDVTFGPASALRTLNIATGRAGRTDLKLKAVRDEAGHYDLDVSGPVFDASYFWKELNKDESRGAGGDPPETPASDAPPPDQTPITLTANIGEMWLGKESPLKDVSLVFDRNRRVIQKVDLKSTLESGEAFTFALTSADGQRSMSGQSADGGGVVKSIGLFDDIRGGALKISGTLSPQGTVEGQAEITDFKLVEAPLVARILSVAALTGIADELRGQGISFKTLRVPFTFASSTLNISEAEMFGNSLGLTAKGSYRFTDSEINMEGTVVPAYALNAALNAVPILGTILTGPEKGGGIFAANFSWRGPTATSSPTVNPLSVLTPGITRKIFSIFGGGTALPPVKLAPEEPVAPN
jgi:hypothetical protein